MEHWFLSARHGIKKTHKIVSFFWSERFVPKVKGEEKITGWTFMSGG